jgi:DNA-directed RNA polymerase specialized sigma24 family protein
LKYREIADRLACSEKAAQNLVHRARERHALGK